MPCSIPTSFAVLIVASTWWSPRAIAHLQRPNDWLARPTVGDSPGELLPSLTGCPPTQKWWKGRENRKWWKWLVFFIFGVLRGKNDRKAPYFMVKTPMGFLWIFWGNGSNPHQSAFRATAHAKAKRICHPPLNSNTALPIWSWGQ